MIDTRGRLLMAAVGFAGRSMLAAAALAGCLSTKPDQWAPSNEDPTLKRAI
jgi:hypothetical protein